MIIGCGIIEFMETETKEKKKEIHLRAKVSQAMGVLISKTDSWERYFQKLDTIDEWTRWCQMVDTLLH